MMRSQITGVGRACASCFFAGTKTLARVRFLCGSYPHGA
jgi:hypothetical protein